MFECLRDLKMSLVFLGVIVAGVSSMRADTTIPRGEAKQYFSEATEVCQADSGRLWGKSLCVPMMFVDGQSGAFVANENNAGGSLKADSGVFLGQLPTEIGAANTAIDWGGKRWTMIMWPLPGNKLGRADLMMHECFHNIEPSLQLDQSIPANAHLDTQEGRIWLRLEFAALATAMEQSGEQRKTAIADALLFRRYRRLLFPSAAKEECQMEMHEGLAQYTGHALCGLPRQQVERQMSMSVNNLTTEKSLVASFAYWSGAAYGMLLDDYGVSWRKGLTSTSDLGQLLAAAADVKAQPVDAITAEQRAAFYDGDEIKTYEISRANTHKDLMERYRKLFVDGATLQLPLQAMQYTYDPNNLFPLDTLGTVYPVMRLTDRWGVLEVQNGVLVSANMTKVTLAAPADTSARPVVGQGWTLDLAPGWTIVPGARKGDMILSPAAKQ
jgi:hypothetical protein